MIRVLIADDHAIVRQGLRQILDEADGIETAAEARDGAEALQWLRRGGFHAAILDISMPGRSGMEVLKQARKEGLETPVLVLSMHPESQYAIRALRAGAAGYLAKSTAPAEIVDAVRKVAAGGRYVTDSLAQALASRLDPVPDRPLHETLSDREFEVLRSIGRGHTVSEIAQSIGLSVKTVSTYRSRLLEKMAMRTNAELTRYALEHGLA